MTAQQDKDDQRREAARESIARARTYRNNNPGRASSSAYIRPDPPPGGWKKFKMSDKKVKHAIFVTPLGEFDDLDVAMKSMRAAGLPYVDDDGNRTIQTKLSTTPKRDVRQVNRRGVDRRT